MSTELDNIFLKINPRNNCSLIKIGPSKDNKKNCTLIDDSTIIDKDTEEIHETSGTEEEPHRGFKMYEKLSFEEKTYMMNNCYDAFIELNNIYLQINSKKILFDPINILEEIVNYAVKNNLFNLIYVLSCEISDTSYLISIEEQINLLKDKDNLYKLWNDDFITNNHGKLRIYILCIYFMNLVSQNKIHI
jgi:hypothetical protein